MSIEDLAHVGDESESNLLRAKRNEKEMKVKLATSFEITILINSKNKKNCRT